MRRFFLMLTVFAVAVAFAPAVYADDAVKAAEARFKEAREAYIAAKEELSEAQINALFKVEKEDKAEAVARVKEARLKVKNTKQIYKETLKVLHEAEMARDAKKKRSPWK